MKKWSLIVAILYALACVTLFIPLALIAFFPEQPRFEAVLEVVMSWQMWAILAVMVLAQFALLRIPVAVASKRRVARRHVITTALAAAFMMGILVFGAFASIFAVTRFETGQRGGNDGLMVLLFALGSWLFWAIWFYSATKSARADGRLRQITLFLWTGSIIELLVAIPTHIIARQKNYCCATVLTFFGLTCGMSVMLFAFGPAVYFLFAERWKRLHPNSPTG